MSRIDRCKYHTYIKIKTKSGTTHKCQKCPHYIVSKLAIGRDAQCNYCGGIFLLDKENIRLEKPHCGCKSTVKQNRKATKKKVEEAKANVLDDLVKGL